MNRSIKVRTYDNIHTGVLAALPANWVVGPDVAAPDAILQRSNKMPASDYPGSVRLVVRAGVGVDKIPMAELTARGVAVANTPGANADGVAELEAAVWSGALRNLRPAQSFVRDLDPQDPEYRQKVERDKKRFTGREMKGVKFGVVGLGEVGYRVAQMALNDRMEVYGYDPFLTPDMAWKINPAVQRVKSLRRLLSMCEIISLNLPLNDATVGMIGEEEFALMQPGAYLMNFAREELVQTGPLLWAIDKQNPRALSYYLTDWPIPEINKHDWAHATPHVGGQTEESEEKCALMGAENLVGFFLDGVLRNVINYPSLEAEPVADYRLMVLHANSASMTAQISSILAGAGVNIVDHIDRTLGILAASVLQFDSPVPETALRQLRDVSGVYHLTAVQ